MIANSYVRHKLGNAYEKFITDDFPALVVPVLPRPSRMMLTLQCGHKTLERIGTRNQALDSPQSPLERAHKKVGLSNSDSNKERRLEQESSLDVFEEARLLKLESTQKPVDVDQQPLRQRRPPRNKYVLRMTGYSHV